MFEKINSVKKRQKFKHHRLNEYIDSTYVPKEDVYLLLKAANNTGIDTCIRHIISVIDKNKMNYKPVRIKELIKELEKLKHKL